MADGIRDSSAVDDVLDLLEFSEQGSRKLDCMIACCLSMVDPELSVATQAMLDALIAGEGFSQDVIGEFLNGAVAPYTRSLDARIPGESIVLVIRSSKRGQWAAVHKAADGKEYQVWAHTEILARRMAGLRGWRAAQRLDSPAVRSVPKPPAVGLDQPLDQGIEAWYKKDSDVDQEWAILF